MADGSGAPRGRRVVVVGGGLAGVRAAQALRARGFGGPLTIVEAEAELPCDRPPLSKEILRGEWTADEAALTSVEDLKSVDIDVRLAVRAAGLDLGRRAVVLEGGKQLRYDGLILAAGARARRLPHLEAAGARVLRDLPDALALRELLGRAGRIAIVGAGVLGLEIASSARALGCEVTVLDTAETPLVRVLGPAMGPRVQAILAARGVRVVCSTSVASAARSGDAVVLTLSSGGALEVDGLIVAVGAEPDVAWLTGSGLALANGIVCDAFCAAAPMVYAAGDAASFEHAVEGPTRLEHWTNAAEQAEVAAGNLLWELQGHPDQRLPYVPTAYVWSDQFDRRLQVVGFPRREDEVVLVQDDAPDSFLALYVRDGLVVGGAGMARARHVARLRGMLALRPPVEDVIAQLKAGPAVALPAEIQDTNTHLGI